MAGPPSHPSSDRALPAVRCHSRARTDSLLAGLVRLPPLASARSARGPGANRDAVRWSTAAGLDWVLLHPVGCSLVCCWYTPWGGRGDASGHPRRPRSPLPHGRSALARRRSHDAARVSCTKAVPYRNSGSPAGGRLAPPPHEGEGGYCDRLQAWALWPPSGGPLARPGVVTFICPSVFTEAQAFLPGGSVVARLSHSIAPLQSLNTLCQSMQCLVRVLCKCLVRV